jgi:hypothetical protein
MNNEEGLIIALLVCIAIASIWAAYENYKYKNR